MCESEAEPVGAAPPSGQHAAMVNSVRCCVQEVEDVLFKLRLPAFESDIDAATQALDTNGDGNIDHDEFVRWCMDQESVDEDEQESTESSDSGGEGLWR